MLPRGAAVSILAVGSVTAVLGGGYLLQQQAPVVDQNAQIEGLEEPPDLAPAEPAATVAENPSAPASPASSGGPAPAAKKGAAPSGNKPQSPAPKGPSTIDRIMEAVGRNQPASTSSPPAGPGPSAAGTTSIPNVAGVAAPGAETSHPLEAPSGPTATPRENYRDVIVPKDFVVEVVLLKDLSSAEAKVEAPVEARITRTYRIGEDAALPENSRLIGLVSAVEQQGSIKGRGRIEFRFYQLRLPDGSVTGVETPLLRYEGPAPAGATAKKAGGAALGGAAVGILLGGAAGAVKGATAGAAAATAGAVGKEPVPVVIPANIPFDVRLASGVRVYLPAKGKP